MLSDAGKFYFGTSAKDGVITWGEFRAALRYLNDKGEPHNLAPEALQQNPNAVATVNALLEQKLGNVVHLSE
ncbi:hypothetical protein B0181_11270 [Moraxella caviae]|uniref:Uncharacterized protein n=2 Tax=Moraxella caviae TaxID=34060 RepID=A0A1S9ZUE1_9GAMM|nr:hypothetical protein [Moraxella caviae]OOR87060.1 hypothetical protein B0181_11270 [Moraxella caviae]STZ13559.1 Uncharacterised protein [Moraxella caviae]